MHIDRRLPQSGTAIGVEKKSDRGKKSDARTALTGSCYRYTGYNRTEVISARCSLLMKARIMTGGLSECTLTAVVPANVFHTITGHHRIFSSISPDDDNNRSRPFLSSARLVRKSAFVWISSIVQRVLQRFKFHRGLRLWVHRHFRISLSGELS